MKIAYVERDFADATFEVIDRANAIIAEYVAADIALTLRQLYYRFVAADLLPNTLQSYKRLGSIINDARLAGLVDWDAIVDRTRNVVENPHWSSPARILDACVESYREDLWRTQEHRVEVWIEKEALSSVFEPVCQELDVPMLACRGYNSQSEMWAGGRRLFAHAEAGQTAVVLHFGDHDPSGIDMSRDIRDRLDMFMEFEAGSLVFHRVALNMDQIEEHGPPPNPAKMTDSRFVHYVAVHGRESWELDALEPRVLAALIRDWVARFRDDADWDKAIAEQEEGRRRIAAIRESWDGEDGGAR